MHYDRPHRCGRSVVNPLEAQVAISETLIALSHPPAGPLALQDPRDLAERLPEIAEALRWSVRVGGQHTEQRALELAAHVLAFLLARARVEEMDITAGGGAA